MGEGEEEKGFGGWRGFEQGGSPLVLKGQRGLVKAHDARQRYFDCDGVVGTRQDDWCYEGRVGGTSDGLILNGP